MQLPLPAATLEQLLVCEKSPEFVPVMVTLLIVSVAFPGLVTVIDSAVLLVLTTWFPKLQELGEKLICGVPVPVPVSETVCGDPPALSLMESVALRLPVAEGVNVTEMVQLPFELRELPQLFVWLKSPELVPVMLMLLMVNVAVPGLVTVIDSAVLLVLTSWLPKPQELGEKLICGAVPVPLSDTV